MNAKPNKQTPPREYDRSKTDRIIANEMICRAMSDAKWVRLLNALSATIDESISISVRLVWDKHQRTMWIRDAQYNFDYYSTAMEAMIGGYPRGWYDYKEIEWVTFSGNAEILDVLKKQIDAVGIFDIEPHSNELFLYAYRRGRPEATNISMD